MKTKTVRYERKVNDGNYGSVGASVEVELEDGDTVETAQAFAEAEVTKILEKKLEGVKIDLARADAAGTSTKKEPRKPVEVQDAKPTILEGEALEEFKKKYGDLIEETRDSMDRDIINEDAAAMIVARQLGMTGKPKKRISDLTANSKGFDIVVVLEKKFAPKPFTKKDGGESSFQGVVFSDETGEINATLFGREAQEAFDGVYEGTTVLLENVYGVGTYKDNLQLNLGNWPKVTVVQKPEKPLEEYIL